jgi:hypothetical protein
MSYSGIAESVAVRRQNSATVGRANLTRNKASLYVIPLKVSFEL